MERKINSWLKQYARTFKVDDWYNDCDMIDSCISDLKLAETDRNLVSRLVDEYITNN